MRQEWQFSDTFNINDYMEKKEFAAQPAIVAEIVRLQNEFNLPVHVIVGGFVGGDRLRVVTLEYELMDWQLAGWLVNRATCTYTKQFVGPDGDDIEV